MTAYHAIFITRAEAKALGLKRYFTGEPCIYGHIEERHVCDFQCLECGRIKARGFRKKHSTRYRLYTKRWIRDNPDKISVIRTRAMLKWRTNNPNKVQAERSARRARKLGAEGSHSEEDIRQLRSKQKACAGCGVSLYFVHGTIDHIKALVNGGTDNPDNLQLLCQPCNDSKHVKDMSDWYPAWDINQYVIGE